MRTSRRYCIIYLEIYLDIYLDIYLNPCTCIYLLQKERNNTQLAMFQLPGACWVVAAFLEQVQQSSRESQYRIKDIMVNFT